MAKELVKDPELTREMLNYSNPYFVSRSRDSIPQYGNVRYSCPIPNTVLSSSLNTLSGDRIRRTSRLERWLQTPTANTATIGLQRSMVPMSNHGTSSTLDPPGLCYLMAMLLPLFSVNNIMLSRYTPSAFLNTIHAISHNVSTMCNEARRNLYRFAEDQIARDVFATMMDIILVIYAIGFLALSFYQVAVFA